MKILCLTPSYPPYIGGLETAASTLNAGLRERGHRCLVITDQESAPDRKRVDWDGIEVHRLPIAEALASRQPKALLPLLRQVAQVKERFKPDVIHIHAGGAVPMGFVHLQTIDAASAPMVVTCHDSLRGLKAGSDTILGQCLQQAVRVVFISKAMMADGLEAAPSLVERSEVIYIGVQFPETASEPPHNLSFLGVGRIVTDKGFDIAVDAFARIYPEYRDASLTVVGDGTERSRLMQRVRQYGLGDTVSFPGHLDQIELEREYAGSMVVVMPSRWREGFGLVAVEAALRGRPVIGTRVGGLPEVVLHGKTGLLIEPDNAVSGLSNAMERMLCDPELVRSMGAAARQHAIDRFSMHTFVQDYESVYLKATDEPR